MCVVECKSRKIIETRAKNRTAHPLVNNHAHTILNEMTTRSALIKATEEEEFLWNNPKIEESEVERKKKALEYWKQRRFSAIALCAEKAGISKQALWR